MGFTKIMSMAIIFFSTVVKINVNRLTFFSYPVFSNFFRNSISNYYKYRKLLHGCSAEGHVSHIYSDRMSSRPMGWKNKNIDNMSKLRLLREDNISVKTILEKQEKIIDINEYKEIKIKAERKT